MDMYTAIAVLTALIMICACMSKVSSWIKMPTLLVFLGVGMLAGSEGIGKIDFDNAALANVIGSIAMAFILFSGGYDTSWKSVKRVFGYGGVLSSLGVFFTALFVGFFTWFFLGKFYPGLNVSLSWCLLLGSVISSTDAAAVFAILRGRGVSLKGNMKPLLEFESGSNDPMAAFLTIFMLGVLTQEQTTGHVLPLIGYWIIFPSFLLKMSLGILFGYGFARLAAWIFNKIDFEYDGLYYVIGFAVCLLVFSLTELCQGNGFMAVYAAGMTMGNLNFVYRNGIGRFYDGIAWLMQIVLFAMLGLLSFPSQIWEAKWIGIGVSAFLMLIARPLAVFLCMIGKKYNVKEKLFVSWVGLRGGAPIMLATFPLMADITHADMMFHIVFFIVLSSVFIQGMTLMPAARLLRLDSPYKNSPRAPLQFEHTGNIKEVSTEIEIPKNSFAVDKSIAGLGLPKGALVLLIRRKDGFILPQGDTMVLAGDYMLIMGSAPILKEAKKLLNAEAEEDD